MNEIFPRANVPAPDFCEVEPGAATPIEDEGQPAQPLEAVPTEAAEAADELQHPKVTYVEPVSAEEIRRQLGLTLPEAINTRGNRNPVTGGRTRGKGTVDSHFGHSSDRQSRHG